MRLFNSFLVALTALLVAGSAAATVRIDHVVSAGSTTLIGGDPTSTVTVQVRLNWDGQGSLNGVFSSTTFDSSVLTLVSNTTAPASILSFTDNSDPENPVVIPGLSRLTTLIQQPGDPASVLRTVQYGAIDPVDPRAATTGAGRLIMTLVFKGTAAGGTTNLSTLIANGDAGAVGDSFVAGSSVSVTVTPVPEPGTVVLMGLGLAGLGIAGRRR